MALFEQLTARLIAAAGLKARRQRMDSTHSLSNIKVLTRLGLFIQTLTQFLAALRKQHPRLCGHLPTEILERGLDREGYFSDAKSSEGQRRLQQVAQDVWWVIRVLGDHKQVRRMPEYGYASGENILAARERGTEPKAPIGSKESEKAVVGLDQFELDAEGEQVLRCPNGEEPRKHTIARGGQDPPGLVPQVAVSRLPPPSRVPGGEPEAR